MKNRSRTLGLLIAATLLTSISAAQTLHTPDKGSLERKAILDALRVPVEKELRQMIAFKVESFNVLGNWAFLNGTPQTLDGAEPVYSGTKYETAISNGAFDNNFSALLKRSGTKWSVVKYRIGCTDVCYADWWKQYRTPKQIFPYTE